MYRALASGTTSVARGASLSGATRSSQRRAGISHKSMSAGIVGVLGLGSRCATAIVSLRECNHGRNPGDYGGTSFQQSYWLTAMSDEIEIKCDVLILA